MILSYAARFLHDLQMRETEKDECQQYTNLSLPLITITQDQPI